MNRLIISRMNERVSDPMFSVTCMVTSQCELRGSDSNRRPEAYETPELPLLYPAEPFAMIAMAIFE